MFGGRVDGQAAERRAGRREVISRGNFARVAPLPGDVLAFAMHQLHDYSLTDQEAVMTTSKDEIAGWLRGRLPDEWFTGPVEVTVDREEIQVIGTLGLPEGIEGEEDGPELSEAAHGRISRFREETRDERITIAREAEHRFGRKIAWGAECGPVRGVFTNLAVPVMTRLRQSERIVLDTLVEAGVARSRADALAWCVRLVGEHSEDWLAQLREAMTSVQRLREQGPAGQA
jgi:hypothetical protein